LLLLSEKGRALMAEVLTILTGQQHRHYEVSAVEQLICRQDAEHGQKNGIMLNAYTAKQVAHAKRALQRKGIEVGQYITAFPLRPARRFLSEIREWVTDRGGSLQELEDVGKPDGMVVVDLPSSEEQFAFVVTFRLPQQSED